MFARLMGLPIVDPATLQQRMQREKIAVFDVNTRASWSEARVPGARHFDPESFDESQLPPDRGAAIVFYCSNPLCRKAPLAARRARKLGYSAVAVLAAGISGWIAAGLATESGA